MRSNRAPGGKLFGYDSQGKVIEHEADVVREIFTMAGEGASCRAIAATLNRRAVPSPGASWQRRERCSAGWMGFGDPRAAPQSAFPWRDHLEPHGMAQ